MIGWNVLADSLTSVREERVSSLATLVAVLTLLSACSILGSAPLWLESDGQRLLSDASWVWCSANPDSVEDAARTLGLGDDLEDGFDLDPVDAYRACSAAAASDGGITARHPAESLLGVARLAGFVANDNDVLQVGLNICAGFDEYGVTSQKINVEAHDTYQDLGPLPHSAMTDPEYLNAPEFSQEILRATYGRIDQTTFAAEMVVGAAAASICPEYASEVAAFE